MQGHWAPYLEVVCSPSAQVKELRNVLVQNGRPLSAQGLNGEKLQPLAEESPLKPPSETLIMNHLHCMMKEKGSYHLFHKLREKLFVILAAITPLLAVSQLKN